jgi:hypothetical protein
MLRNTIITTIAAAGSGKQFRAGASGIDAPSPLSQRAKRRSHLQARVDRLLKVVRSLTRCARLGQRGHLRSAPAGISERMRVPRSSAGTKSQSTRPGICRKPGGRSCSQP